MQYFRIHATPDGASHFEDVKVEMVPGGGQSDLSAPIPVMGLVFVRMAPGYARDLHTAPQRQFVVPLAGEVAVVASGGVARRVVPGVVMLAEDTTGAGHTTRNAGDGEVQMLWLVLPGETLAAQPPAGGAQPLTSYFRIYAGPDGESHFEDVPVPAASGTDLVQRSALIPVTSVMFRRSPADQHIDWHPAPRRQFVVTIAGEAEVEASDGEVRRIRPGTVMLAEDVTGKGHITRGAGTAERLSLFVPLAE